MQLTIGTEDVYKTANAVELQHGKTTRPPGPLPGIPTKIYGCLDPDAWKVVSSPLPITLLIYLLEHDYSVRINLMRRTSILLLFHVTHFFSHRRETLSKIFLTN